MNLTPDDMSRTLRCSRSMLIEVALSGEAGQERALCRVARRPHTLPLQIACCSAEPRRFLRRTRYSTTPLGEGRAGSRESQQRPDVLCEALELAVEILS